MRPVEERFNPHRNIKSRTVTSKYIIVTEGYRTEQIYFDALRDNRSLAGHISRPLPLSREATIPTTHITRHTPNEMCMTSTKTP